MTLTPIPSHLIDAAYADGAYCLSDACETSGGEITGSQLKMILSRGERSLIRMDADGKAVGWGVVRVDQLPNMRVLFVTDLVAPGAHFETFFTALKDMAAGLGCSRIRCAAKPSQERLYQMKCNFQPVYNILEVMT
jgi:hypothetical protein